METIFGESPSPSPLGSSPPQQPTQPTYRAEDSEPALTHIDSTGEAKMVDVSHKHDSKGVAIASCKVLLGQKVFNLVASNQIAKGDVLTVAKIAGITGAKQTSNLIPMCHNINLFHVRVDLTLSEEDSSVVIEGEATTSGKTGVEMEAMTAVAIAGLTIYDVQSCFKGHLYNRYLSSAQVWGKEWILVQELKGSVIALSISVTCIRSVLKVF